MDQLRVDNFERRQGKMKVVKEGLLEPGRVERVDKWLKVDV